MLSVWSDKQNAQRTWTPPAGTVERSDLNAPGTGAVSTMLADSNGPVAAGTVGGLTATVSSSSNRATVFTIVLDRRLTTNAQRAPADRPGPAVRVHGSCGGFLRWMSRSGPAGRAQGWKCVRSRAMSPNASHSAAVDSDQRQSPLAATVGGRLK